MSLYSVRMADRWRSTYNPLRGLTMSRVVSLLEEGERGAYADLQWVYRTIEKRDATLRGVKRKLRAALTKLDWDIKIPAIPSKDELTKSGTLETWLRNGLDYDAWTKAAEYQRQTLRAAYDNIANLKAALGFLALAEFRGYAHIEVVVGESAMRLEPIPQWHWCRDGLYGDWAFNAEATSGRTTGEWVDMRRLIVREVEDPVDEIALISFVRKSLSQKDWDGFVEVYGIPAIFGVMPPNVPEADRAKWEEMIDKVVADARGTLPNGSDVKTVGDSVRGIQPFESHIRYQDEQTVLAGTSGKLTMLTASTGMNSGQADAQSDTFDEIAVAQAGEISEVMQEQFDVPLLDRLFPGQPHLAYFELAAKEQSDVDAEFDRAGKATAAGYHIPSSELSERTGYQLTDAPVPAQQQSSLMLNRFLDDEAADGEDADDANQPVDRETALDALEEAYASDMSGTLETLQPYLDAVEAAQTPEAVQVALKHLQNALSALPKPEADKMGDVLSNLMGQEVLAGAQDAWNNYKPGTSHQANISNSPRRSGHYVRDNSGRFANDPSANVHQGKKALDIALRRKNDVKNAMAREETGPIDFDWGTPGEKKNGYKGGRGLSHIKAKHGDKVLADMPKVIARGKVKDNPRGGGKIEIEHEGSIASLAKRPKGRAAVVTSYKPKNKS